MGITDKITGRVKKAAGDLTDDASLRREGRQEERKGEAKDELARDQERADRKAEEVANLERKTAEVDEAPKEGSDGYAEEQPDEVAGDGESRRRDADEGGQDARPTRPRAATTARPRATPAPPADQPPRAQRDDGDVVARRGLDPERLAHGVVHDLLRRAAGGAAQHLGEVLRRPHPRRARPPR